MQVSVNVVMPLDGERVVGNFRLEDPNGHKFGHRVWVTCILAKEVAAPFDDHKNVASASAPEPVKEFAYPQELASLRLMGFNDDDVNKYLLLNNNGNVQTVVEWLLTHSK